MLALIFPVIAAVAHAADVLIDRFIMTRQRLGHRQFTLVMFMGLYVWSALTTLVLGGADTAALSSRYLAELVGVIAIASFYNLLYYQGIEKKHVEEFEPVLMLSPLAIILVAGLVYPAERDSLTFIVAIVAALALAFPYYNNHRGARWDIYQWRLLLYVLLTGVEAVLIKDLLTVWSPATLYAVRTGFILTVLVTFYTLIRPIPLIVISRTHVREILLLAILPVVQMITLYYAYATLGLVLSTLIFLLYPLLSYTGARLILREKLHWKNILSGSVVLACVAWVLLFP